MTMKYRFSSEGITYLASFLSPMLPMRHIKAVPSVPQTVCIALRYFATGRAYFYVVCSVDVVLICYSYSLGCLTLTPSVLLGLL